MTIKDEHPCSNCQYFYGWQEVEVNIAGMCEETICVDIPICFYLSYVFALGKCKYFIKGD